MCYPYACNGGTFCSTQPCGFLSSDGNATMVPAWDASVDTPQSEPLDGGAPAWNGEAPKSEALDEGVPAWNGDDDVNKAAIAVPV